MVARWPLVMKTIHHQNRGDCEIFRVEPLISVKDIRTTIFKVAELVEVAICQNVRGKRGEVMHDGWSHNGTHYLGRYALFINKGTCLEKVELVDHK